MNDAKSIRKEITGFYVMIIVFFLSFISKTLQAQIPISLADFETNSNALTEADYTKDPSIWNYYNGTAWVPAYQSPDSTHNIFIRALHLVNLNNVTIAIAAGKTITVDGTLTLGTGHIKGGGTVVVDSAGTLNFGSKLYPIDAVADNISATGGVTIKKGSISIFSGLTQKAIAPRTFGSVYFRTKSIIITGDITVQNVMSIIDSSSVIAQGNITLGQGASASIYGTFSIVDGKQVLGPVGTHNFYMRSGSVFNCTNTDGFWGGNGSGPGKMTALNSNVEKVYLYANSTVKYSAHAGLQAITPRADYQNIIIADTAIKLLKGYSTFARNLTINAGSVLVCDTITLAGSDTSTTTIKGTLKVGSVNTAGAMKGNIPFSSISQQSGSIIEFNGTAKQYVDNKTFYNLIINNPNSAAMVGDVVVKDKLTLNNSYQLELADKTLTINGILSNTGTLSGSANSNLIMNAPNTVNFTTGYNLLNNFTVNCTGSVVLGSNLGIAGVLSPLSGTLDLNSKIVTLKAGTNNQTLFPNTKAYPNTGTVGQVTGTINYGSTGTFVEERFVPELRRYRILTPVVIGTGSVHDNWQEGGNNVAGYGTQITGAGGAANGFDPTATNNPSLFLFDNLTQAWAAASSTTATGLLTVGSAWRVFVRGDRLINLNDPSNSPLATPTILRTTGRIQIGDITYNKTGSLSTPKLNPSNLAYSLVGNPYPSSINFDSIVKYNFVNGTINGTITDIRPEYTIIDPTLSSGVNGIFVTYNVVSGSSNSGSKANANIQPGQAFFLQTVNAATNPSPSPSITFKEANKTASFTKVFRTAADLTRLSVLLLLNSNDSTFNIADGVAAVFDDAFSTSIGNEDSYKITNSSDNLAINHAGSLLSIEGRPSVATSDTIPLNVYRLKQKSYYMKFVGERFPAGITAVLKDAYLQQETPVSLNDTTLLAFDVNSDTASFSLSRFKIIFKSGNLLPVSFTDVKAYRKESAVQVDWTVNAEKDITSYEVEKSVDGRQFAKAAIVLATGNSSGLIRYSWLDNAPNSGNNFYRIRSIGTSGLIKYSSVVNCKMIDNYNTLTVFPNPVKNGLVAFTLRDVDQGTYSINIFDNLGKKVYAGEIEFHGGVADYKFGLREKLLNSGTYLLQLNNRNTNISRSLLVE